MMAFHIDILPYKASPDAEQSVCEIDYTVDDCINRGWLSAEGIWTRQTVEPPDTERIYPDLPCPDPRFGQDLKLKLLRSPHTGKWVADIGGGLLFR